MKRQSFGLSERHERRRTVARRSFPSQWPALLKRDLISSAIGRKPFLACGYLQRPVIGKKNNDGVVRATATKLMHDIRPLSALGFPSFASAAERAGRSRYQLQ